MNTYKAIDRMEATTVAPVRAVRPVRMGVASLRWQATSINAATENFNAPTEDVSAGRLYFRLLDDPHGFPSAAKAGA